MTTTLALGKASEYELTAELLRRGHNVAIPVVDDHAVDLVVNYRLRVQVKSSQRNRQGGYSFSGGVASGSLLRGSAEIFVLYGRGPDVWWIIPRSALERCAGDAKGIGLNPKPTSRSGKSTELNEWIDAWHLFEMGAEEIETISARWECIGSAGSKAARVW